MDTLYTDYDDVLIGRIHDIDASNFYGISAGGSNQTRAISCIRYALEKVLAWDTETIIRKFDNYIIHVMKLDKLIPFIEFPVEVAVGDPRYILSIMYPHKVKLNQQKLVEKIFKDILDSRKLDDADDEFVGKQFPRGYFSGREGFNRFCYCVKFLLDKYIPIKSIEEIYAFFDSPEGKKCLCNYRLGVPAEHFSINMHEVIFSITKNDKDSAFYHAYYTFKQELLSKDNSVS